MYSEEVKELLADVGSFLERRSSLYPGGVPEAFLAEIAHPEELQTQEPPQEVESPKLSRVAPPVQEEESDLTLRFGCGNCTAASLAFVGSQEPRVPFDTLPFWLGERELLEGAITKGLRQNIQSMYFANVRCAWNEESQLLEDPSSECVESFLGEELNALRPQVILFLGRETLSFFSTQVSRIESLGRGSWFELHGIRALWTHSLSEVIRSKQVKREFWSDLQKAAKEAS